MTAEPKPRPQFRKWLKYLAVGCGGMLFLFIAFIFLLFVFAGRPPKSYPAPVNPLPPPARLDYARFGLDGFESPYLGHTGSWDGKGGAMGGGSKVPDLDKEVAMGLRWTFMAVNWRALEPDGPADLSQQVPPAWQELDAFVIEAQKRKLNILMQAPVVGGNAGGPPHWAGVREPGKSAPQNLGAVAEFASRLAARYQPGGTLARQQGWGDRFGVRAWEIDNEPEMYRTHWQGQAGDYAEMATGVAAAIKGSDPLAVIVLPGVSAGGHKATWLPATLDAAGLNGSPEYRQKGVPHSIGPVADVVSFHVYEGLDSAFAGKPRTIEVVWGEVRDIFEKWETASPGFQYARKQDYWHTEGNFDFIGALSEKRRAAWRMQFFTRAFAAGIRKVCVMDAAPLERTSVKTYIETLPWPFPMEPADTAVKVVAGKAVAFRHQDDAGQTWVVWAVAGTGPARVEIPVNHPAVTLRKVDGTTQQLVPANGIVTVELDGDEKMAPPVLVNDR